MKTTWIALGLTITALFACRPRTPKTCEDESQKPTTELMAYSDGTLQLADAENRPLGYLASGDRLARLYSYGADPEEIKRRPGVVDVRICVLSGQLKGKAGYLQNTLIRAAR